jgi:hypothetical protein
MARGCTIRHFVTCNGIMARGCTIRYFVTCNGIMARGCTIHHFVTCNGIMARGCTIRHFAAGAPEHATRESTNTLGISDNNSQLYYIFQALFAI